MVAFEDIFQERYLSAFPPAVTQPAYVNLGDYRIRGAETSWQQNWTSQWSTFVGFTWLDPNLKNLAVCTQAFAVCGHNLRNNPWRLSADAQYLSAIYVLQQARTEGATKFEQVSSFTIVSLRVGYAVPQLGEPGDVFVVAENLFESD